MFAQTWTPLALLSFACSLGSVSQACAQAPAVAPVVATHSASAGTPLRRISAPGSTQLVYEYEAASGKERLVIDPGSLLGDINRMRNRAEPRRPVAKIVSIAPVAPRVERAEPSRPAKANAAQSETPAPVAAAGAADTAPRKVRIIPLLNVPKENYR